MSNDRKKKDRQLYYLLPSMGKASRMQHRKLFRGAVIAGAIFAALFGYILYLVNKR
jgi:hypothetical protein